MSIYFLKPSQAEAIGLADTKLIVDEHALAGQAQTHRVEIILMPLVDRD